MLDVKLLLFKKKSVVFYLKRGSDSLGESSMAELSYSADIIFCCELTVGMIKNSVI